jgi:Fe-S-cluster containining protein
MTEQHENENNGRNCHHSEQLDSLKKEILAMIDEKFDVEAVAQMVEQLKNSEQVQKSFQELQQQNSRLFSVIESLQNELRNVMMDVALVKRALVSLGQVGVMERQRIEKELILELFPPKHAPSGLGVVVAHHKNQDSVELDCEKRIPVCQQACCRIFNIHLNSEEAESGRFDWNPRMPYTMLKNHLGCTYLSQGKCLIYHHRPKTCFTYSCKNDRRIWEDYEKMVLNSSLKQRLISNHLLPSDRDHHVVSQQNALSYQKSGNDHHSEQFSQPDMTPPDFSQLRQMLVPEPLHPFVPQHLERQQESTSNTCDEENTIL